MYKGIIFDFNGTMLRDNEFHIQAWIAFAERYGVKMTMETYMNNFHGLASKESLERLLGVELSTRRSLDLQEEKEALYRQVCLDNPETFILAPGLEVLLDTLCEAGIPRGIATASAIANVNFFIDNLGLERWFSHEHIVFDDGCIRNKPAPDIYLRAAENLGFAPGDLIVVEDSLIGVEAARKAGIGQIFLTGEKGFTIPSGSVNPQDTGLMFLEDFSVFPVELLLSQTV